MSRWHHWYWFFGYVVASFQTFFVDIGKAFFYEFGAQMADIEIYTFIARLFKLGVDGTGDYITGG